MGLSLRKGYGLDNKSLSGDFASKMWSSYTQLNPGVYSDAVATEFKRRMKPDYVENLVPNGGGLNATDWLGTTLPDGWTITAGYDVIFTRVTGNGFTSNACRLVENSVNNRVAFYTSNNVMVAGVSYTLTGKYRSNTDVAIRGFSGGQLITTLLTNNGNAVPFSVTFTATATTQLYFLSATAASAEISLDEITMSPTVSQNYFTTFGPSGLNKTTADWIYLLTTSGNIVSRPITKSGNLLKWNLDGVTVTQNNLPTYTKGTNAGVVTMTSTDGWSGVTVFDINTNNFNGTLPAIDQMINVSTLSVHTNLFVGIFPSLPSLVNMLVIDIHGNNFDGVMPTYVGWSKLLSVYFHANKFVSILNNFGNNKIGNDQEQTNYYPTTIVDSRLAYYNTMFAATPPIKNLTLNLSGATMGIPTGAGSNTDLLGILAKFTTAGFTATIIVRTS